MPASEKNSWRERFDRYIRENRHAELSLRRLVAKGCDRVLLFGLLQISRRDFCGVGRWTRQRQHSARYLLGLARRIEKIAEEVRVVNGDPSVSPEQCVESMAPNWRGKPGQTTPEDVMQHFALLPSILSSYAFVLRTWPSSRVRKVISLMTGRLGRAPVIPLLAHYVKQKTGEPHYGDLAYLLEASEAGYCRDVCVDPATLAKRCERFERTNPGFNAQLLNKLLARV